MNMYLLVPRSRSSAKVKVKYKNGRFGGICVSQTHLFFFLLMGGGVIVKSAFLKNTCIKLLRLCLLFCISVIVLWDK